MRLAKVVCLLAAVAVTSPLAATGCSSKSSGAAPSKNKGSTTKGTAAKGSGQKNGTSATGAKGKGQAQGASYEGVTCDADSDGLAWCDSDTTIVFCSDNVFYSLDCSSVGADVCAEDPDSKSVDCYSSDEVG
jgi:hypothetical protein